MIRLFINSFKFTFEPCFFSRRNRILSRRQQKIALNCLPFVSCMVFFLLMFHNVHTSFHTIQSSRGKKRWNFSIFSLHHNIYTMQCSMGKMCIFKTWKSRSPYICALNEILAVRRQQNDTTKKPQCAKIDGFSFNRFIAVWAS